MKLIWNLVEWLKRRLTKRVTMEELREVLPKDIDIRWNDNEYKLYPDWLVRPAISFSVNQFLNYIAEERDCDDFALNEASSMRFKFPGIPFGIVHVTWTDGDGDAINHALNLYVNNKMQVRYVEPQEATIFEKPSNWNAHFILI